LLNVKYIAPSPFVSAEGVWIRPVCPKELIVGFLSV
tara:strand:+ start:169 stop:276 length:108 start_codon:yes stop_codon:yes gene_type:complete